MTLANIVLQKLSETKPTAGRHDLAFTDESSPWTLYVTADRTDELSVLAWELTLRRGNSDGDVAVFANELTKSSALEPFKVVEIDTPHRRALLRSATPTLRQDKLFYYELIAEGTGSITLCRFKGSRNGAKPQQVAFAITHEALARLVEELGA